MKSKKFSLKNIDDETAKFLDEEYPTELTEDDVDDIFRESYRKFLEADAPDSDTEDESEIIVESSPVEVVRTERRFAYGLGKVCAVLCGIVAATAFYALLKMPVCETESPEEMEKIPFVTDRNYNTSTTTIFSAMTTDETTTRSSETTTAEITVAESVTISTEYFEETAAETEETEFQTEATEIRTEATESPPETFSTSSETTTETTEQVTTDRKENQWGYFTIQEFDECSYINIRYERTKTEPVETVEHTFGVECYSCKVLAEYPDANKVWELKAEEENPPILFQEFSYTYFLRQFDVQSEITFTEINGRPAILGYSQGGYCLAWDDGCHVCSIHAYEPDYDFMFRFAENYK